jgi:cytochrome d ubiquinol oxidase subunit II
VPDRLTLFEAAAAPESLLVILIGALVVLPAIIGYSALSYHVFRGKATPLGYE